MLTQEQVKDLADIRERAMWHMEHGSASEYVSEASEEMEVLADDLLMLVGKIQQYARVCHDVGSMAENNEEANKELRQMASVILALLPIVETELHLGS